MKTVKITIETKDGEITAELDQTKFDLLTYSEKGSKLSRMIYELIARKEPMPF